MKSIRYMEDVVTLVLNVELCVGCGACTQVCPHGVLAVEDRRARIVDLNGCMECGACAMNCPTAAVTVTPGVGCTAYIIQSWIKGKDKASCGSAGCC